MTPEEYNKITYNKLLKLIDEENYIFDFLKAGEDFHQCNEPYLIRCNKFCEHCNSLLKITKCRKTAINYIWRCSNRRCDKRFSIFKGTFLEGLAIKQFLTVLAGFVIKKKISEIIKESGINENTVLKYFRLIRQKCALKLSVTSILLGGPGIEIEIDETHVFKSKYNRGRTLAFQNIWIFGIIERISKKCFLTRVENRSANNLNDVVVSHVREGSHIYGDGWRGYSEISRYYNLETVNHRYCFVDPHNPSIHTNNIERLWRSLKNEIRGVAIENIDDAISLFIFRRNFLTGILFYDINLLIKLFI